MGRRILAIAVAIGLVLGLSACAMSTKTGAIIHRNQSATFTVRCN